MTESKPNLFSFATSELSQDAFICWLLSWAKPEYKGTDKELHDCGVRLINAFFKKHKKSMPRINEIKIRKQYKNIDVLCIINDKYAVIIEDKTGTFDHSNQLERYYDEIKDEGVKGNKIDAKNILPIYYKTEDQGFKSIFENNKYEAFLRKDILDVIAFYKGNNTILSDYKNYLQSISNSVTAYKTKKIIAKKEEWEWHQWIGFYLKLQQTFKDAQWSYAANPSGGVLVFWWSEKEETEDGCIPYLQLEQDKLCFKIRVDDKEKRRDLRWKWHDKIMESAKDSSLTIEKPKRFGTGTHMTVCVCKDYRATKQNKILDIDKTIKNIKEAEKIMDSTMV